eukprot:jgi/Ulvmu1/9275/UM050_0024.1
MPQEMCLRLRVCCREGRTFLLTRKPRVGHVICQAKSQLVKVRRKAGAIRYNEAAICSGDGITRPTHHPPRVERILPLAPNTPSQPCPLPGDYTSLHAQGSTADRPHNTQRRRRYAGTLRDRAQDLVAGIAILCAELHSLQRQQSALQLLLAAAQNRIKGVFSDDASVQEAHEQLRQFATTGQKEIKDLLKLRTQLRVTQPAQEQPVEAEDEGQMSEDASSDSSSTSEVEQAPSAADGIDNGADALMQITASSAAVNIARAEHARAVKLDIEVERLQAERADLQAQIAALKGKPGVPLLRASCPICMSQVHATGCRKHK